MCCEKGSSWRELDMTRETGGLPCLSHPHMLIETPLGCITKHAKWGEHNACHSSHIRMQSIQSVINEICREAHGALANASTAEAVSTKYNRVLL